MIETPEVLSIDEQLLAVIHLTIPRTEINTAIDTAITEILAVLNSQGIQPSGALLTYHHQIPTDLFDFDVGFPVSREINRVDRVKSSRLPAAKVVRTRYHGSYDGLGDAWHMFCSWLETEGLSVSDKPWESYIIGPESEQNSDAWVTELYRALITK